VLRLTVEFAAGRAVGILDERTGEASDQIGRCSSVAQGPAEGWTAGRSTWSIGAAPAPVWTAGLHLRAAGRGIPTSRIEVDGGAVRAAADAAVTLWPNDPLLRRRQLTGVTA